MSKEFKVIGNCQTFQTQVIPTIKSIQCRNTKYLDQYLRIFIGLSRVLFTQNAASHAAFFLSDNGGAESPNLIGQYHWFGEDLDKLVRSINDLKFSTKSAPPLKLDAPDPTKSEVTVFYPPVFRFSASTKPEYCFHTVSPVVSWQAGNQPKIIRSGGTHDYL